MSVSGRRILALFDVDGTLTAPRAEVTPEMKQYIVRDLRNVVTVGIVGGSDLVKQREQMGSDITDLVDYSFSENGLVAYKAGVLVGKQSIQTHLGEEKIKQLVNWFLRYIADLDIPVKRGTFIEFRSGMLNVSPIGRNCSKEERNAYEEYDLQNKVRATMVEAMKERFADFGLVFSIGGQISFDVFPSGWDKTYALNFIPEMKADGTVDHRMDDGKTHPFDEIHFFGDKTFAGGNDYEIFTHPRVIGHTVTSPEDTRRQCEALFTGSM